MQGDWAVQIEDGTHTIHAKIEPGGWLSLRAGPVEVSWDGVLVESVRVRWLGGNIKSFERNGHLFLLSVRGFGMRNGTFVLHMDGVEVPTLGGGANWLT